MVRLSTAAGELSLAQKLKQLAWLYPKLTKCASFDTALYGLN